MTIVQKGKILVLRTCAADMTSYHGTFTWPKSGPVECPDWKPTEKCGNGLHGALWGEGDGALFSWAREAVWQVVEVGEWIDLKGKVKFPRGDVVHTGDRKSATDYIMSHGASGAVIGATATAGYGGTATAGDGGTATAGDGGTATAGDGGTATAGDWGIIQIAYYDGSRRRILTGYVGEDGIKADASYRVLGGKFVEVNQ